MDSYSERDKVFVDAMERLFLTSSSSSGQYSSLKIKGSTEFEQHDITTSEMTMHTVHERAPISKLQPSAVDVPFLIIREPHHDFQAFGDTDGSLSRMEIHKGSNGLITDGKLTTPGLKLVVDKLQILDDNLRQIEEVVGADGNLVDFIHQNHAYVDSKFNFLGSETGDGCFSQETLLHNKIEENDKIQLIKSEKVAEDLCVGNHAEDIGFNCSDPYQHSVITSVIQDRKASVKFDDKLDTISEEQLSKCETPETINDAEREDETLQHPVETLDELKTTDIPKTESGVLIWEGALAINETDTEASDAKISKNGWKNPFSTLSSKFSDIETSTDAVQNFLAATVCVLLVMCCIDNLST